MEPLEPRLLLAGNVYKDAAGNLVVEDTSDSDDEFTIDIEISSGDYVISNNSPLTLDDELTGGGSGTNQVTVEPSQITANAVIVFARGGSDTITLENLADKTATLSGGSGDDTYKFGNAWNTAIVDESAGAGTDTLDFSLLNRDPITIELNPLVITNGANRVSFSDAAHIENMAGANVNISNIAAAVETELLDGLQQTVHFVRNAAEVGDLATELPLIGGSAEVTVAKAWISPRPWTRCVWRSAGSSTESPPISPPMSWSTGSIRDSQRDS